MRDPFNQSAPRIRHPHRKPSKIRRRILDGTMFAVATLTAVGVGLAITAQPNAGAALPVPSVALVESVHQVLPPHHAPCPPAGPHVCITARVNGGWIVAPDTGDQPLCPPTEVGWTVHVQLANTSPSDSFTATCDPAGPRDVWDAH